MSIDYQNLISINDYRNPEGFIYNSDLVTFTEYGAQLKNLVADNVALGATYTTSSTANYGNDTINSFGSIYGTVNIQNNKLALLGGQYPKAIDYFFSENKNLAQIIPSGQATFQFYPNYSNIPSTTQNIFHLGEHKTVPTNHIHVLHTSTGDLIFEIFDKNGESTEIKKNSVVIVNAVTPKEIRVCWEMINLLDGVPSNNAGTRLSFYYEGELLGTTFLEWELFDPTQIFKLGFGTDMNIGHYPNFYISSLLIEKLDSNFSTPNNYVVRSYLPMVETRYTTVPQKIEPKMILTLEKLQDIRATVNEDTSGNRGWYVNYTFQIDGNEYFFDRTDLTWKLHTEPEQISDLGYMLLHKEPLINKGCKFKLIPYLRTIAGAATPQITSTTIVYDQYIPYNEVVPMSLVYGYVKDVEGNMVHGAKILVTPSRSSVSSIGNFILPKLTRTVRTGQNGYWDISLPLSTNFPSEMLYNFQVMIRDEIVYSIADVRITQTGSIRFEDLIEAQSDEDYPVPVPYPYPPVPPIPPYPPIPPSPAYIKKKIKKLVDTEIETVVPPMIDDEVERAVEEVVPSMIEGEVEKVVDQKIVQIQAIRYRETLDEEPSSGEDNG